MNVYTGLKPTEEKKQKKKNTNKENTKKPTLMISTCSSVDLTGSEVKAVLSLAGCTSAKARPIGWRLADIRGVHNWVFA